MHVDRIIDAMAGDEESKNALKLAYKKAFKLGATVAIMTCLLTAIFIFLLFPESLNGPFGTGAFDWGALFATLMDLILFPIVLGAMAGSFSLHFFTRDLKITLPESIAPRVEIKHK